MTIGNRVSVNTNRGPSAQKKQYGVGDALQIVRCNHCREIVLFEHRQLHAFDCRKARASKKLGDMNLTKDGKPLYAVAITRRRRGKWRAPEILYAHGETPAEARRIAVAGETDPIKVIETGLAVGWFQDQQTGLLSS